MTRGGGRDSKRKDKRRKVEATTGNQVSFEVVVGRWENGGGGGGV